MDIMTIENITGYADLLGFEVSRPEVTIIDLADMPPDTLGKKRFGFYCVLLKDHYNGTLSYGRGKYHYDVGTMIFTSPGQVIGIDNENGYSGAKGFLLMFHPDFIMKTSLGYKIKDYTFFAYDVNEALRMEEYEKESVVRLFQSIQKELSDIADSHTENIVASYIETMLNYCLRFYDRQFTVRKTDTTNIISRFEMVLEEYYAKDAAVVSGLPTVNYCAGRVCLSPNYFGELVKKESGKTACEYIHNYVINKAKFHLKATSMNVSEVAFHLGFRYPHHFSRLFKKYTGFTPNEYKSNHAGHDSP